MRLLVVEDEPSLREHIVQLVTSEKYRSEELV